MFRDLKYVVLGTVVFLLTGLVFGWAAGSLAGRYFDGLHFGGFQGKQAAESLGAVIIGLLGALIGANIGKLHAKQRRLHSEK